MSNKETDMRTAYELDMYLLMKWVLEFPMSRICVHSVALSILDLLERRGYDFPYELARDVVRAEDDLSLPQIKDKIASLESQKPQNKEHNQ